MYSYTSCLISFDTYINYTQAPVKGLKNPEIKGFLVMQTKKKSDKRFCALSEGHLFCYKTQAVSWLY